MSRYFPKKLRETNLLSFAEDIFEGGMRVKPQLRKGVWPHLVRVFHPKLETHEERESYLSKLRLIYDSLKGRLHTQNDSPVSQSQHLYDSIRRDAVRTDPNESFYAQQCEDLGSSSLLGLRLSEDNIEKLVNITAIFTLEHDNVAYTQGMTDLLSPILYVMEREDDAYIVFAAMVQRISENFGMWCDGTLKKIERLRHLCAVLDPQLSAHLADVEEDAFALFFGMVLIECRREFSFAESFHLLEVIWAATLCMRQREDPNWSPPPPVPIGRKGAGIQVTSPDNSEVFSTPTFCEWASFMSNRSPDIIQQVFGEVQTYSAAPLTRDNSVQSYTLSHNASLLAHSPPLPEHVFPSENSSQARPQQRPESVLEAARRIGRGEGDSRETLKQNGGLTLTGKHREQEVNGLEQCLGQDGERAVKQVEVEVHSPSTLKAQDGGGGGLNTSALSPGKEKSQSDPLHTRSSTFTNGTRAIPNSNKRVNETTEEYVVYSTDDIQIGGKMIVLPNGQIVSNSFSESGLVGNNPQHSPPPLVKPSQTEMSDMSSVSSNNTTNDRGTLVASLHSGDNQAQGEEEEKKCGGIEMEGRGGSKGEIEECGVNGNMVHSEAGWRGELNEAGEGKMHTEVDFEGTRGQNKEGYHKKEGTGEKRWTEGSKELSETVPVDSGTHFMSPTDVTAAHLGTARMEQIGFSSDGSHGHMDNHDSKHSPSPQLVSRDSSTLLEDTPHNLPGNETEDSLEMPIGMDAMTVHRRSFTGERGGHRPFSPIQPFFDTLESIATRSRTVSPGAECGTPRPGSTLSVILSNIRSMEHSAPAVTRESSLTVPFSDSFPLFICLSIIIQHRSQILNDNLDFVGLSQLLNAQAGVQNLDQTLRIARDLYVKYREYQRLCFGPRFAVYEVWLDNTATLFERPMLHSSPRVGGDEQHTAG